MTDITPTPVSFPKLLHKFNTSISSWQYHHPTAILVAGCSNGLVYVAQLEPIFREYQFFLTGSEYDDFLGTISVDFDLYLNNENKVECVLGNYDGKMFLITIQIKKELSVTARKLAFNVPNRTIITKENIIVIGMVAQIYEHKDLKLVREFSPEDFGVETLKVGEVIGKTLLISSHEGKLLSVFLDSGKFLFIKDIYADQFKIWKADEKEKPWIVAGNNVDHTVSLYSIEEHPVNILTFHVSKSDMKAEYPYKFIVKQDNGIMFPDTESSVMFLKIIEGKLISNQYVSNTDIPPIFTKDGVLVEESIVPRDKVSFIKNLNRVSRIYLVKNLKLLASETFEI